MSSAGLLQIRSVALCGGSYSSSKTVHFFPGYLSTGAIAAKNAFTETVWPVFEWPIFCNGTEENLLDCINFDAPSSSCGRRRVASIICQCKSLVVIVMSC